MKNKLLVITFFLIFLLSFLTTLLVLNLTSKHPADTSTRNVTVTKTNKTTPKKKIENLSQCIYNKKWKKTNYVKGVVKRVLNINGNAKTKNIETQLTSILSKTPGHYVIGIKDLSTGQEHFVNDSDKRMQSASLIKIFIMLHAFKEIKEGKIKLDKNLSTLIDKMITLSDNTATNKLIDKFSMQNINSTIKSLHFINTILQRKMLDESSQKSGKDNFTTVRDLIAVFDKLYKGKCLGTPYDNQMLSILKEQKVNTKIPVLLPGNTIIAHKTGELPFDASMKNSGVENDAGIIYSPKKAYILCIMSDNIAESTQSRHIISNISKIIWDYFITK